MRILKWGVIALAVYVGLVVVFESVIGYLQPSDATTLKITTFESSGDAKDRIVSRLEVDGRIYVAANHWPRAWYRRALESPQVRVAFDGNQGEYVAVPVETDEHARVAEAHPLPPVFRFLTGFPPRYFLRLEPALAGEPEGTPNVGAGG